MQRFFFVLTALARISITFGLLERPLVLGLAAGWLTGRWDVALPLAVFLELFWLDIIRLGAIVPPSGGLSFLLLFPFIVLLRIPAPEQLPLPLLLCCACAYVVARLERVLRERNDQSIAAVTLWCAEEGGVSPARVVWTACAQHAMMNGLLYVLCFSVLYVVLRTMQPLGLPLAAGLSWNVLYGAGLMGAVLSLRTRRAYAVLGTALTLIVLLHL